jgi:hypothetical protein
MSEETNLVTTVGADPTPAAPAAGLELALITKTVQVVKDAIQSLDSTPHASALDQVAYCKRAEQALELIRKRLTPFANDAYQAQAALNAPIMAANGTVSVGKYTAKASWQYPAAIVALEESLRSAQKAAQLDGTAKKITPIIDPKVSVLFSLSVLDV